MYREILVVIGVCLAALAGRADTPFLLGGDISMVPKLESLGAVYRDAGKPSDAISIMREHGCNCFRIRLFVNPTMKNAGDAEDPSDSAEYWNYLLYKGVADNLASNLNTWLVGAAKGATWQPIHATYKQNFADISPVIDDPDVGTLTTPAPGAAADVDPPTNFTFSIAEPALTGGSQFEFTFDSHSNFTYQIQMAQSLKSNVWSDHGSPIAASSNRTTAVIDLGAESKGYYRIVLTQ